MITLKRRTKFLKLERKINIPNAWGELSGDQYVDIIKLAVWFTNGLISLPSFRLQALKVLSGYKRRKRGLSKEKRATINVNLAILSGMATFPVRPEYKTPEYLEILSPGLQKRLKENFPSEIYDPEYFNELEMVKNNLEAVPVINLDFRCNPLPVIQGKYKGPVFDVDKNGVVTTDIIALEFIDAAQFADLYYQTREESYLGCLVSVLYRKNRKEYGTYGAMANSKTFEKLSVYTKYGALFFFQSIIYYLSNHPQYGILYEKPGTEDQPRAPKLELGLASVMAQLTKEGFGTRTEIEHLPLGDYLTLLLKQISDAVKTLRDIKKKDHEIAGQLQLSINTVIKI